MSEASGTTGYPCAAFSYCGKFCPLSGYCPGNCGGGGACCSHCGYCSAIVGSGCPHCEDIAQPLLALVAPIVDIARLSLAVNADH